MQAQLLVNVDELEVNVEVDVAHRGVVVGDLAELTACEVQADFHALTKLGLLVGAKVVERVNIFELEEALLDLVVILNYLLVHY